MVPYIDTSKILSFDALLFFGLVGVFLLSRYLLHVDIEHKSHGKHVSHTKQNLFLALFIGLLSLVYLASLFFEIQSLQSILQFSFSLFSLYIITLIIHRKILLIYGEEVEVSGQNYFKKGYKVNIFSLFVNIVAVFVAIFLCIKIFSLDSWIEIGGLWAGILAFMWFTAPVWALDMIAGIIMLQSKNLESGDVFYIYESNLYVWIKSISLTEVKCIDLKTGNPIIFRPSKFRDLTFKNLSHGISGKSSKILRSMEIQIDYQVDSKKLSTLCEEAFDLMHADVSLGEKDTVNYFGEEPFRRLEMESFDNYAVSYTFLYTITSPFYVFSSQRLLNTYLLEKQREYDIYFSTPHLVDVAQK